MIFNRDKLVNESRTNVSCPVYCASYCPSMSWAVINTHSQDLYWGDNFWQLNPHLWKCRVDIGLECVIMASIWHSNKTGEAPVLLTSPYFLVCMAVITINLLFNCLLSWSILLVIMPSCLQYFFLNSKDNHKHVFG